MAPQRDPRVTDLRRYRRERERARRAQPQRSPNEPLLGRRKNAGLILVLVIVVIAAMTLLSHTRF